MPEVGQKVNYVPDQAHALDRDANGNYPWVLGFPRFTSAGKMEIEELAGHRIEEVLNAIRRHPNPAEERRKLTFIRPCKVWPATITAAHEDGTVNLDIQGHNGGVTIHYEKVPYVEAGQARPHSCYS